MSLNDVVQKVNPKMVKIYGSGGFKGLPAYGTGVLVSPNGYVLTVANHLMETTDLRVHLYDGTRLPAKLIAMEPELDIALLKIGTDKSKIDDLPFYDIVAAAKTPLATQCDADILLGSPAPPSLGAAGQPILQPASICQTIDLKHMRDSQS